MWLPAVGAARQHHAAVAAAEAAAHDLFERDVAGAAVCLRELGAGAHHWRRSADVKLHRIAQRPLLECGTERHGDAPANPAAAVFAAEHDIYVERLEQLDAVELFRAPRAVEERAARSARRESGR